MEIRPLRYDLTMQHARNRPPELTPETPAELQRLLHFLNSRAIGYDTEALPDARSAETFLEASGFALAEGELDEAGLALLLELRSALAAVVDGARPEGEQARAWDAINAVAAASPVVLAFGAGPRSSLGPTGTGARGVVERVLADLHAAVADGRFARLRLCAFEPCAAAFYDATRSRTQRWHSYATCGNRVNVAAHRERAQRAADRP
jgi:predicted RNA-binding Zn ribbon-like protein